VNNNRRQITLCDDGADEVVDTTLVLATSKTEEALLTPSDIPRVLDDPVLGTPLLTITNNENTVVHAGVRASGIIDTAVVEAPVGSINTNRERAVGVKSSDHGVLVLIDESPLGEVVLDLALVELASLVNTLVRIVILADHTDTDSISESVGHETAITAVITDLLSSAREDHAILLTVDKLLLRDNRELLVGNKVSTLHSTSGRESPARTTVGLVLNLGDSTIINPVLGSRVVTDGIRDSVDTRELTDRHHTKVLGGELLLSKISKLVKSKDTLLLTVKVLNESKVALESLVADSLLLSTVVNLVVLDGPLNELVIDVRGENTGDDESNDKDSLHCNRQ